MNKDTKINLDDTPQDMVIKLSGGNPGALTVCLDIVQRGGSIDPDGFDGGIGSLLLFDSMSLYGSRIWMLYKDVCGEDLVKTVAMLRAWQLGFVSEDKLKYAVDNYGNGIDKDDLFKQVKDRLPNFDSVTKPEEVIEDFISYPVEEVNK